MTLSVIVIADSIPAALKASGDVEYIAVQKWGEGFEHAQGKRIAVLSGHYHPSATWIDAARATTTEMSWGAVEPGTDWPYYLLEYADLLGNPDPRKAPGGNVVYHRSVLERYPMKGFAREVDYHAHLVAQGISSAFLQTLAVQLVRAPEWKTYRQQRFNDSRQWAVDRELPLSALPLRLALPPLILARIAKGVFTDGRYIMHWLQCLPRLIQGSVIQMLGEMSGILSRYRN